MDILTYYCLIWKIRLIFKNILYRQNILILFLGCWNLFLYEWSLHYIRLSFSASTCEWMSDSHSVVSNSLRPHRLQATRLLCPWKSLGNNIGVGCHFFLHVYLYDRVIFNLLLLWQIILLDFQISHHPCISEINPIWL